jgi:hypothetical protein
LPFSVELNRIPTGSWGWLRVKDGQEQLAERIVSAYWKRTTPAYQVNDDHLRLATLLTAVSLHIDGGSFRTWRAYLKKWQATYKKLLAEADEETRSQVYGRPAANCGE